MAVALEAIVLFRAAILRGKLCNRSGKASRGLGKLPTYRIWHRCDYEIIIWPQCLLHSTTPLPPQSPSTGTLNTGAFSDWILPRTRRILFCKLLREENLEAVIFTANSEMFFEEDGEGNGTHSYADSRYLKLQFACLCFQADLIWMIILKEHFFKMVWKGNPIVYNIWASKSFRRKRPWYFFSMDRPLPISLGHFLFDALSTQCMHLREILEGFELISYLNLPMKRRPCFIFQKIAFESNSEGRQGFESYWKVVDFWGSISPAVSDCWVLAYFSVWKPLFLRSLLSC